MNNPLGNAVLTAWRRNNAYGLRLVEDLSDVQFVAQPIPGRVINHPAWILSHLNLYSGIAAAMLRGEPFADPIDHPHGMKSEPSNDPRVYGPRGELIERFRATHEAADRALESTRAEALAAANPIDRWRAMAPTVGDMLLILMVKHESHHLGQLSMWRRAMGLPRVAM